MRRWPNPTTFVTTSTYRQNPKSAGRGPAPSGRKVSDETLALVAALPDEAIAIALPPARGSCWYGRVRPADPNYVGDADFAAGYSSRAEAITKTAAKVRADLAGHGRYAPHWDEYDARYRMYKAWVEAASRGALPDVGGLVREATSYSVELSVENARALFDSESPNKIRHQATLLETLGQLRGVDDIEYDGHFGPFIHFRILAENDTSQTHAEVRGIIQAYVEAARRRL
jgi:hypothetical protein